MLAFARAPLRRRGLRALRDQRARVPDLLRDPRRRPGGADRRSQRRPGDPGAGPGTSSASTAAAGPLRADDAAPVHRPRPHAPTSTAAPGHPADRPGGADHPLAGDRRGGDLDGLRRAAWAWPRRPGRARAVDPLMVLLGVVGVSMPVYWLGEVVNLLTQSRLHDSVFSWVPPLGYVAAHPGPGAVGAAPAVPVAHPGGALRRASTRGCCARRCSAPSTRTTCAPPGPRGCPSAGSCIRHALRCSLIPVVSLFGLDFGALVGRVGAAHRGRVRPARGRQADLRRPAERRPAGDHGHASSTPRSSSCSPTRSSTCSTPASTRGCVVPEPHRCEVRDLRVTFRSRRGADRRRRRADLHPRAPARCSASSASRARARACR